MNINVRYNEKYSDLVKAIFDAINKEYERFYWNKHQEMAYSPFRNEGADYSNKVFSVHSYKWDYDEGDENDINFNYKDGAFCAVWYKHAHRGLYFWRKNKKRITAEFLNDMLKDCLKSLREDFECGESV